MIRLFFFQAHEQPLEPADGRANPAAQPQTEFTNY